MPIDSIMAIRPRVRRDGRRLVLLIGLSLSGTLWTVLDGGECGRTLAGAVSRTTLGCFPARWPRGRVASTAHDALGRQTTTASVSAANNRVRVTVITTSSPRECCQTYDCAAGDWRARTAPRATGRPQT